MNNQILLDNIYLPGQLESAIDNFVDCYNDARYHESLNILTSADVYYDRGKNILNMQQQIK